MSAADELHPEAPAAAAPATTPPPAVKVLREWQLESMWGDIVEALMNAIQDEHEYIEFWFPAQFEASLVERLSSSGLKITKTRSARSGTRYWRVTLSEHHGKLLQHVRIRAPRA